MNSRSKLGPIVVGALVALCAAQVAVAQVNWNAGEPVVPPGDPGSWDSVRHQVGDVVFDGTDYHLYLVGGNTVFSWGSPWKVGHWVWNTDTQEWDADPGNPVLEPEPGTWDGYTIYGVAVLHDGTNFRMWYGASAVSLGYIYVGYAESADGSSWTKYPGNPLSGLEPGLPLEWDDAGVVPITVLMEGDSYRVWFWAVGTNGAALDSWRIGTATSSDDGITWTKHPDPVLEPSQAWEEDWLYAPEIVPIGDGYGMWYSSWVATTSPNTAQIGYAVSPDGIHWGKWPGNPVVSPQTGCPTVETMAVIVDGNMILGWVEHCYDVYHVKSPFELLFFDGLETSDTGIWSAVVP